MTVIQRVIAGEGLSSAMRRARGRIAEALRERMLLWRGRFVRTPHVPILNVLATPASARLGGIQVHLLARLQHERILRPVALLTPGILTVSRPAPHGRRVARWSSGALFDDAFVRAVREAVALTGAHTIHLEGAYGIPTGSVLQLIDGGLKVILSLHDYSLLAADPHHPTPGDLSSERHLLGRGLLQRARAVVFPSEFLRSEYHRLADAPDGPIIPAGIPIGTRPSRRPRAAKRPRIAFAGTVATRKGAALFAPVIAALPAVDWFVFGGGDAAVLASLRKLPHVHVHGQYAMGALPHLLAQHGIDLVLLLSTQPELYSLTLSESWVAGLPVVAFAHGAIEERVRREGGGWLVPLERGSAGVVAVIERWIRDGAAPEVPRDVATAEDAARAVVDLYAGGGVGSTVSSLPRDGFRP